MTDPHPYYGGLVLGALALTWVCATALKRARRAAKRLQAMQRLGAIQRGENR